MKFIQSVEVTDASRISINATDEAIAAWSAATTYADLAQATYLHGIYESRQASNTNHVPTFRETDLWWRYLGPLNSWAMFDETVETQTINAESITFKLRLTRPTNALAILNCEGATVHAVVTDPIDGVVYDRTVNMTSVQGINNLWRWLYSPIDRKKNLVLTDLPMYANADIDITISNPGADAKCGVFVAGVVKQIGQADYGVGRSIKSFSKITENEFGNRIITHRSYAKRMSVPISVDRLDRDYVVRQLEDNVRDVPVVWIASEDIEATIIFGIYESFEHVISTWDMDRNQLVIQGLI